VRNVSIDVAKGEILAIVGESGSGKSVTALSILRLLPSPPTNYPSGKILFHGSDKSIDLLHSSMEELQSIRGNNISMIFQEPMTSLNPVISCGKQVGEALLQHNEISETEAKAKVIEWFEKVKLPDPTRIYNSYPHQLSGGQTQRVMIAMAMCCEPELLICDEPTTALDVTVQKTILELITDLQKEKGLSVIFITHDLGVVAEIAHRVVIMYKGGIVEEGDVKTIFNSPRQPYTKALIQCRPANHPKGEPLPTVADFISGTTERKQVKESLAPSNNVLVAVKDLTVRFPVKTNWLGKVVKSTTAVDQVSFEILKGETLGIVGESGCGKTTLGRTLLRLITPASGEIIYKGEDLATISGAALKQLRKNVQLVFQDPYSSLNPRLTIGSAIAEPMEVAGIESDKKLRRKKVAELLEQVDLSPDVQNRYPHEFSGGQRQRIVIARALALDPSLLVCDESVSALDVSVQAQVLNLLNDLKRDLGLTLVFISHDLSVVRYMSDRILVMNKGRIEESGTAEEIYNRPKSDYTKKLLISVPKI
jgi:peptide/nickel transport system ATP-binding protein